MTETPDPAAERPPVPEPVPGPPVPPSKPNFAGALLLSGLLVAAGVGNYFSPDRPVAPSWMMYGLMLGILFLLGVDVSKILSAIFRRGGDS